MDKFTIAIVIYLILIFTARTINNNAMKKLDQSKKAALIDLASSNKISTYALLIVIIIFYFICTNLNLFDPTITYIIYFILLLLYILFLAYKSYNRLKKNDFPDFYIKSYILSLSIRVGGLILLIALL